MCVFTQIFLDSCPVPLFSSESRGPSTACVTLSDAVSDVIQQLGLTDRRIIRVMAQFVTLQSSRPLNMFKQVKLAQAKSYLNLCYLSSHAGADQNQCRTLGQASFCDAFSVILGGVIKYSSYFCFG